MANAVNKIAFESDLIPCQVSYKGPAYNPITHKEVIDTIDEYLYKNNLRVRDKQYLAASNGQKAIGKVFIDNPGSPLGYSIFWKNSLDGSMSFGLAGGSVTFICSNGSVYGDVVSYKRMHVGNARNQVLDQIQMACNQMEEAMQMHVNRMNQMKEMEITKRTISSLVGQMFLEDQLINSEQLNIIKREMENPSYEYNAEGSVWEFYSHVTCATKQTTPPLWHKVHKGVGDIFVNRFGLLEPKETRIYAFSDVDDMPLTLARN